MISFNNLVGKNICDKHEEGIVLGKYHVGSQLINGDYTLRSILPNGDLGPDFIYRMSDFLSDYQLGVEWNEVENDAE